MIKQKLNIKNASTLFSVSLHLLVMLIFFIISALTPKDDLVEIRFGEPGGGSGGYGPMDKNYSMVQLPLGTVQQNNVDETKDEKSVEVPEVTSSKTKDDEKISSVAVKIEKKIKSIKTSDALRTTAGNNPYGKGIGNGSGTGSGVGNGNGNGFGDGLGDGFGIDWGGRIRKIYNYTIPKYPDGVYKNIDVKLRFSILPDGTVGNILVVKKADSRLEQVAIDALRMWRFEPIPGNQQQTSQSVVITFPFRLE